jgi:two-component system, chemotaxis family, protein-glutamate methylesterase/glutaminase
MTDNLKILIADNNDTYRALLSKVVAQIAGAEVVDTASDGRMAMAKLRTKKMDLILLEMGLPFMDGLKILEQVRECHPHVGVVVVSAACSDNKEKIIQALEMGAIDFISKSDFEVSDAGALVLRRRLMALMGLFRARRGASLAKSLSGERLPSTSIPLVWEVQRPPQPAEFPRRGTGQSNVGFPKPMVTNSKVQVVALGVSTGGPNALAQLIPLLPGDLGVPLLLVQHMPATMTASLAYSLNRKSALQVREAVDGEEVLPNCVYLAPGGKHMIVTRQRTAGVSYGSKRIRLTSDPPVNSCRPSADVLFQSVAEVYEGTILAVLMTGMGNDGTEGVRALKRKGCYCLAQTQETCVVYGMPRSVIEAGLSDEQVDLDHMAQRIATLIRDRNQGMK